MSISNFTLIFMSKSKSLIAFFSVVLSIFFLSCESKSVPNLLGKWETEVTLKSELAGNEDSDSPQAFLFTKQKISLSFAEGGVYSKKVVQRVDRVEFARDGENAGDAKEYFAQYFDKDLTFDGEYDQMKAFIVFKVQTVQNGDAAPEPYIDYFVKDPSIGDDEVSSAYEVKDGELLIDGVSYKKSL